MRRVKNCVSFLLALTLLPLMAMGDNQQKAEEIASVLQATDVTEGCDIGLKYQDETVWLTGVVDDATKIATIQQMVEGVAGVGKVVNQLEAEQAAIADDSVQQVAARSVVRRPHMSGISSEQIISDEVVAVDGVPVNSIPADEVSVPMEMAGPSLPEMDGGMSVLASTPNARPLQASKPIPIRAASYGTTVSVVENAPAVPTEGVSYGGIPGTPMAIPGQTYGMPCRDGACMRYDRPHLPNKAWPSYASYPNTAAVQYPKRHTAGAWPYIGPHYPYPQVPDGWRKVTLEWHDGYWHLDFDDGTTKGPFNGLFRRKP